MSDESTGTTQAPSAKEQASDALKDYNVDFSYHKVDEKSSPFQEQKLKETHRALNATTQDPEGIAPQQRKPEEEHQENKSKIETGQGDGREKEDSFSKRFAMLADREQKLLQREKELKRQEQERNGQKFYTPEQLKQMIESDPYSIYDEVGIKADDIINKIAENPRNRNEQMLMDEIKNLNKKIDDLEKNRKEESNQSTIQRVKAGIKHTAMKDPDKYELINSNETNYETVLEVMKLWHHEKGKTLQIHEALDIVENHLDKQLDRITKYKKFQNRFKRDSTQQSQTGNDHENSNTINNDLTAHAPSNSNRQMSNEESLSRAAQMLRWNS